MIVGPGGATNLNGHQRCHDESFMVTELNSSCWRLVPFAASYCSDIPEVRYMSGVRHRTTANPRCVRCVLSRKFFAVKTLGDSEYGRNVECWWKICNGQAWG